MYCVAVEELRPLCQPTAENDTLPGSTVQCPVTGDDSECRVGLLQRYAAQYCYLRRTVNTARMHAISHSCRKLPLSPVNKTVLHIKVLSILSSLCKLATLVALSVQRAPSRRPLGSTSAA